jgi:hypothetical protein
VFLQPGQVVEGIGAGEPAGMDQAHERVADVGALRGLVEKSVLAVKNGPFQHLFAEIIVQRRADLAQKQRQLLPMLAAINFLPNAPVPPVTRIVALSIFIASGA